MINSPTLSARYSDRLDSLDIDWLTGLGCVLWFRGKTETDCPIIPGGVSATPAGSWTSPLTLANGRTLVTFNGSTNYISLTDDAAWNLGTDDFTIGFWGKFAVNSARHGILEQYESGSKSLDITIEATNKLTLGIYNNSAYQILVYSAVISNATWYFAVIIKSGTTTTWYINGSASGTPQTGITGGQIDLAAVLTIGLGLSTYSQGNIKDLFILKGTALTEAQITYIYNTTKKYLVI
jgi:hypothetical protein